MSELRWQSCPKCQANNPRTATFCGQCYTSFEQPKPPAPVVQPPTQPAPGQPANQTFAPGQGASQEIAQPGGQAPGQPLAQAAGQPGGYAPSQPAGQPAIGADMSDADIQRLLAQASLPSSQQSRSDGGSGAYVPPAVERLMGKIISSPALDPTQTADPRAIKIKASFVPEEGQGRGPNTYGQNAQGELTWTCGTCGSTHSMDAMVCYGCGRGMAQELGAGFEHELEYYIKRELMFPGLGFYQTSQGSLGFTRIAMTVLWIILFIALLPAQKTWLMGVPYLLAIAIMWISGPSELRAAHAGRPVMLTGNRLLYMVVIVFMLSIGIGLVV